MSGFLLPFVVAATFVLPLACDSEKQTVFPNFSSAIVYGTVFEDAGATVAHALVILEHRPGGCSGDWIERDMTGTDSAGHYRSVFSLGASIRQTSCFVVLVSPPSGSALEPSPAVPFTVQFHPGLPRDSVRVDVTLTEPTGQ